MLYHRECSTQVIAGFVQKLIGDISIGRSGITVLNVEPGSLEGDPSFFCPHCDRDIPVPELGARCMHCGNMFPVEALVIPRTSGGTYCREHAVEFFSDEQHRSLTTLFSNFRTNVVNARNR